MALQHWSWIRESSFDGMSRSWLELHASFFLWSGSLICYDWRLTLDALYYSYSTLRRLLVHLSISNSFLPLSRPTLSNDVLFSATLQLISSSEHLLVHVHLSHPNSSSVPSCPQTSQNQYQWRKIKSVDHEWSCNILIPKICFFEEDFCWAKY
jgi:hypothetical protein